MRLESSLGAGARICAWSGIVAFGAEPVGIAAGTCSGARGRGRGYRTASRGLQRCHAGRIYDTSGIQSQ